MLGLSRWFVTGVGLGAVLMLVGCSQQTGLLSRDRPSTEQYNLPADQTEQREAQSDSYSRHDYPQWDGY